MSIVRQRHSAIGQALVAVAAATSLLAGAASADPRGMDGRHHQGDYSDQSQGWRQRDTNDEHQTWGRDYHDRGHHWRRGQQIGYNDWSGAQQVDYRAYHLRAPPRGYEWRQSNGQFLLVAVATGLIPSIILSSGR